MKVNHFLTSTLAATALLVASCSTQKLAQNNSADDVYNTTAQARVYKYAPPVQTAQIDTSRYDANYRPSDREYDMDYASRIDRFYYGSPNRVYFDDYYNFYGYNSWYNPYDWSLGFNYGWGFNRWYNPYTSWGYYGSPYYWNTWGPYSYYNPWYSGWYGGGWGGGYWGGGWGGSVIVGNSGNFRPRPNRGAENGIGTRPNGSVIDRGSRTGGNTGFIGRTGSRPEAYNPTMSTDGSGRSGTTTRDSRPSRGSSSNTGDYRPTRTSESSRPTYTPPPSSSGSSSTGRTGGSSSSSGGSSGGGGSRPTRGGGR